MKRRTSESVSDSAMQDKILASINSYDISGLTMNADRTAFTAGVEAFDLDENEISQIIPQNEGKLGNPFKLESFPISSEHFNAQKVLCSFLEIPLYYIFRMEEQFLVCNMSLKDTIYNSNLLDYHQFIDFWSEMKGTVQTHSTALNGADGRIGLTSIDDALRKSNLEWGGNVDGFIIENNEVKAIIDCISIRAGSGPFDGERADPRLYFFQRGPRYETWLATALLAERLKVPHILFTIDKQDLQAEHVGMTTISALNKQGVYYKNDVYPYNNIVKGMDVIKGAVHSITRFGAMPQIEGDHQDLNKAEEAEEIDIAAYYEFVEFIQSISTNYADTQVKKQLFELYQLEKEYQKAGWLEKAKFTRWKKINDELRLGRYLK